MNLVCLAGVGLLMTAGMACTPPATMPVAPALSARPEHALERSRRSPGFTVPGSQVGLPGRAPAGGIIEGRAPAGSRVEAADQILEVGEDMHFRLRIPADTRGVMPVRVVRPDGTVLVLRVKIVDG